VSAARSGDRTALDQLLRRHYDRLYGVCRRLAGNDSDGADATQEALLAIVRGLPRFDGRSSFRTWSYRVATNACLDELRRRRRRPVVGVDPEAGAGPPGIEDPVVNRLVLDEALLALDEDFRVAVVLRDLAGLDYAEIAEVLGVPPGTVRSRIARGRRHLATILRNQEAAP
jgi:RNA polymerase sigma-70 factor (ECF subfamily)